MTSTTDVAEVRAALQAVTCVLCDADGNLFPSEEPAFVASKDVTNDFLAAFGVARRYEAEELRLATTGLNFRSTAIALALEHGVPVDAALLPTGAASVPAGDGPALDAAALQRWVEVEAAAVTAHLRTALHTDPAVLEPLTAIGDVYDVAAVSSSADGRIAACFEVTGLRLGLGAGQAVAVEDSVPGATSAVRAGWPTIGNLQFVGPGEREQREADLLAVGVLTVVSSWSDVQGLLPRCAAG
ncbi:HAD family phosphatase [Kineococcus rubinsiae]|uniref:HAD family phosphatase n=1 Tax=Kineococcus rubinsiae TaxID=2609562 RepID=UPI00358DC906